VTVTCPGCKRKLNVPDTAVGKTVTCPACKTPVAVEEKLEIMPAGDLSSPDPAGVIGPAAGQPAASCPNCGFPLLPTAIVCNRCGTDRFSGEQDKGRAGFQAGFLKRVLGRSGWILTLLVGGGIAFGIYMGVTRTKKWAEDEASGVKGKDPAAGNGTEQGKPRAGPRSPKNGGAKPVAGPPAEGPGEKPPADVDREAEIAGRFEEAFALLMDPLPDAQKRGKRQLTALGADAVPHVAKRYSESEDPAVRLAMVQTLARLNFPGSAAKLAEALGDKDDGVREEAVRGLVARGSAAAHLTSKALASDDERVRSAAITVAARLSLRKLAPDIVALLAEPSARVRWQAATCLKGRMATKDAYPNLVAALDDKSLDVAVAAAEALAGQEDALPLVLARFEKLPDEGVGQSVMREILVLAVPILASHDLEAKEKLAERICVDRPLPKVISLAKRLLATPNVSSRMRAMTAARTTGGSKQPMPLIMGVGLMDRDVRVRTAALRYFATFPSEDMALPLIIRMGDDDLELAMSAALEIGRFKDKSVTDALRQAVKGVAPLRTVLAAGVLARKDDPAGADVLKRAAVRELRVPSPVPGWSAYQLSLLGKRDLAGRFAAEAGATRSGVERVYYTAAAARLGDEKAQKKLKSMLVDRRTPINARVELARLLALQDPDGAKQALLEMLYEPKAQIQIAALGALADIGDADVIPGIMGRTGAFTPAAAEAAKAAVIRFGRRAEAGLLASLSATDRRECVAALEVLTGLARQTSRAGVEAVVETLKVRETDVPVARLASKALAAMTGRPENKSWKWREWAGALGIKVPEAEVGGEEGWGWITAELPKGWTRLGDAVTDNAAEGRPTVRITTERDPAEGEDPTPRSDRRYKDSAAMLKSRLISLAYRKVGDQVIPLLNVAAQKRSSFSVGSGAVKARASALLFTNKTSQRTTYFVFLVYSRKDASWYAEVECSVATANYAKYKRLFEKEVARSIKIDTEAIK
jgi:HEAT repeat protein